MDRGVKALIFVLLILFVTKLEVISLLISEEEIQQYDGKYNNRANPNWGTPGSKLLRLVPTAYGDDVYHPSGHDWPNARLVSERIHKGPSGLPSYMNRTVFLALFGQFVTLESVKAIGPACPRELTPIEIPKCDSEYDKNCTGKKKVPFLRAAFDKKTGHAASNPREQTNHVSSWIDGSVIYGNSLVRVNSMREFQSGLLKSRDNGLYPPFNDIYAPVANPALAKEHKLFKPERQWLLGDTRLFQHPAILAFGTVFFRWHNFMAKYYQTRHPDWDDDRLFHYTRKWVIATFQKIVAYDFYPAFTNETLPVYTGYKPHINPGVTHIFQSAAFRFGHTQIPPGFYRRDSECNFNKKRTMPSAIRMCNSWFKADEALDMGIEPLLLGMASQITEREDHILVDDVRGKLFGPLQHSRRDLAMVNILRGRDNGLPDYNSARVAVGLEPIQNWTDINPRLFHEDPYFFQQLKDLYQDINKLDIFVGGLIESRPEGPGPLFLTVIRDHFTRLRDGDRFWFENRINRMFTEEEINEIKRTTLVDIITNVTDITMEDLQPNAFFWLKGDPCPQPKQLEISDMDECNENKGYNFFSGSEYSFILICIFTGSVSLVCVIVIQCLASRRHRKVINERIKKLPWVQTMMASYGPYHKILALDISGTYPEWVLATFGCNQDLKDWPCLMLSNLKGVLKRTVCLKSMDGIRLTLSSNDGMKTLCLHVPNEYGVILKFEYPDDRQRFCTRLKNLVIQHAISLTENTVPLTRLIDLAETKKKRKHRVEKFLKYVFARVYSTEKNSECDNRTVMRQMNKLKKRGIPKLEISRSEFAEALSMKEDSTFIEQMFFMADTDGNGYVSFQEFLDVLILLYKGSEEDKLRLLFDIYDTENTGVISRQSFTSLIRSVMEITDKEIKEEDIQTMLESMLEKAGFQMKTELTYPDFEDLFRQISTAGKEKRLFAFDPAKHFYPKSKSTTVMNDSRRSTRTQTKLATDKVMDRKTSLAYSMWQSLTKFLENNHDKIMGLMLFYFIVFMLFAERAYHYAVEVEHSGIRQIAGYGIAVTRGCASVMAFTYSVLLLTMCKNTLNLLRKTWLASYIPFDTAFTFHRIVAWTSVLFTFIHVVGHFINFYHISTQPPDYVSCIFPNAVHFRSDYLTTFQFWFLQTPTGLSGVFLAVLIQIVAVFATPWARKKLYTAFMTVHTLYIVVFALIIFHGSAMLVQEPWFLYFFIGPLVLFTYDKLISLQNTSKPIKVMKAELLPSNVVYLVAKRPEDFHFKPGQWCRLAMEGHSEFHPFTITTSPHDNDLSFHIAALGPWTCKLKEAFCGNSLQMQSVYPKIFLDGPFGGTMDTWDKYDISVMIAGGLGVTPFSSILKHINYLSQGQHKRQCQKVYFIWVTKRHTRFEWLFDILHEIENSELTEFVSAHVFITEVFNKYDLRTFLLYMFEKHFTRLSDRSLLTGLQAPTHFGRPQFKSLLQSISKQHQTVNRIGVFSCGPRSMSRSIGKACALRNRSAHVTFVHHAEHF